MTGGLAGKLDVSRETPPAVPAGTGFGVSGLRAGYGRTARIEIPSLELAPGTVTAILGPNGSGKSTLLRCLARQIKPLEGTIMLAGRDISRLKASEMAREIAVMPQESQFPFQFTPRELATLGASAAGFAGEEAQQRIESALIRFEIDTLAGASLTALSGGERQRASLARAFAQVRHFLLLDEPTSHLDLRHQAVLRDAIREIAAPPAKAGVVIVLHDLNFAASFADRIVLMESGRVIATGAPEDVLDSETVQQVYRTQVRIVRDSETGGVWLSPERPS